MTFEQNMDAAKEIIEFAKQGVLCAPGRQLPQQIMICDNFEKALYLALEEEFGDEGYSWSNIRELEIARIYEKNYQVDESNRPLGSIINAFLRHVADCLERTTYPMRDKSDLLIEAIADDLYYCYCHRVLFGIEPGFFETMFHIYRSGGWPCGWQGNYPGGHFIAYVPKD